MFEITIFDDICGVAYTRLIEHLIQKCDSFLFHLPNVGKMLINERNSKHFPEYPIGYTEEIDQHKHNEYIKKVQPLLEIVSADIIEQYKDTGYLDQTSNIEVEVFRIAMSKQSSLFFSSSKSIFSWRYPNFPEDLCFFSKGICIFQCIAHEKLCFLNCKDPVILALLKENKIDHVRSM